MRSASETEGSSTKRLLEGLLDGSLTGLAGGVWEASSFTGAAGKDTALKELREVVENGGGHCNCGDEK